MSAITAIGASRPPLPPPQAIPDWRRVERGASQSIPDWRGFQRFGLIWRRVQSSCDPLPILWPSVPLPLLPYVDPIPPKYDPRVLVCSGYCQVLAANCFLSKIFHFHTLRCCQTIAFSFARINSESGHVHDKCGASETYVFRTAGTCPISSAFSDRAQLGPAVALAQIFQAGFGRGIAAFGAARQAQDKIIVAKQRSGPAGTYIKVRFDGPRGRWEVR
jgi:hypothetical protein